MLTNPPNEPFVPSSERPPFIEKLRAESRGLRYRPAKRKNQNERLSPNPRDSHRLFTIEKGNRWMELARREPEAKMLLGELWHQGELCMLFADTNAGKSVLAVQIGESLARGQSPAPFTCQAPPARVLYIDFELTQSQFGQRYSQGDEDHQFSDNFYRAQYNFIPDPPPNVDENELLIAAIEYKIQMVKATVLIIDNITCLRGGTENSAVALALMKSLKALKTDHNLSILVLAHTPKRRNPTQPISADDLHGSKLLINFADSAFAIGKSTAETDLCYLKQIKQRNTAQRYGADNVCLCRIQKPGAFLHFTFEGHSAEHQHLLSQTAAGRRQLANKIAALAATGLSQRDISKQLGIGLATVNRLLRSANHPMTNDLITNDQKDGEGFENLKMRKFENEEESSNDPLTNDLMTNDEIYPMTNDVMTNDQTYPMTNDVMTNDLIYPMTNDLMTNDQKDEEECANALMTNDIMTNDLMTNNQMAQKATPYKNPNPTRDQKTSTIDKLLTPQLLDHIKRGTAGRSGNDEASLSAKELREKSGKAAGP